MMCWPFRHGGFFLGTRDIESGYNDSDLQYKLTRLEAWGEHYVLLESKINEWHATGNDRLLTMSSTFVGLTCIGLVPAFIGTQQFAVDQERTTWMLWLLTALSTTYLFWYFAAHVTIPMMATYYVRIIKNDTSLYRIVGRDPHNEHHAVDVAMVNSAIERLDSTYLPALDKIAFLVKWGATLINLVRFLEWFLQVSVFGLSLAILVLFFFSTRTEDFEQAGKNQLAFSVWLFIINVISSVMVAFTRYVKQKM
ncbi:hypothetical protein BX666DRAFT_1924764, partial [Dichotomocladium elegans]